MCVCVCVCVCACIVNDGISGPLHHIISVPTSHCTINLLGSYLFPANKFSTPKRFPPFLSPPSLSSPPPSPPLPPLSPSPLSFPSPALLLPPSSSQAECADLEKCLPVLIGLWITCQALPPSSPLSAPLLSTPSTLLNNMSCQQFTAGPSQHNI